MPDDWSNVQFFAGGQVGGDCRAGSTVGVGARIRAMMADRTGTVSCCQPGATMTRPVPQTIIARIARRYGWRLLLLGLLCYAFIYDNSASVATAEGYRWTRLVALPRTVRVVETLMIGLIVTFLCTRRISRLSADLLLGCVVFTILALASYAVRPVVGLVDFFRLVYMYLLPVLVFVIARESRSRLDDLKAIFGFIIGWVLVSAAVSWLQLALGYPIGDDITGLNQDSHANATLMMLASFALVAGGLIRRNWRWLLIALALMATAVLPSALKMMLVSLAILGGIALQSVGNRRRLLTQVGRLFSAAVVLAVLVAGTFEVFSRFDIRSSDRLGTVLRNAFINPSQFGPIAAHRAALNLLVRRPAALLVGYGPYSYTNAISMGQTLAEGPLSSYALEELRASEGESGEDARVTLTTSLAVEFGMLALLVQAAIVVRILGALWQATRSSDRSIGAFASGAAAGVLLLATVAGLSLFGSISGISVSWVVMILAGLACRVAATERARGIREAQT